MNKIGKRVYLRPLEVSDAKHMLDHVNDEEIRYMTGTRNTFTLEAIENHIIRSSADKERHDFAICLLENEQFIGELSIIDIDVDNLKAGFRISMNSMALTGKGLGTEATQLAVEFIFEDLHLNRVQLEVYSHNPRGIRAYEKVGFIQEGVLRESLLFNHTYSDEIIMAMTRKDYENSLTLFSPDKEK